MSLVNILLSPVRVAIVTDTAAFNEDGTPAYLTSKAVSFPHLRAIAADIGVLSVAHALQREAAQLFLPRGFDDLLAAAPELLSRIIAERPERPEHATILAGWSESRGRMVAVALTNQDGRAFEPVAVPDGRLGLVPGLPAVQDARRKADPRDLFAHALAQRAAFGAERGFRGIGGELVMTTLTKAAIETKVVYRFPDFSEMCAAMAKSALVAPRRARDPLAQAMEEVARQAASLPEDERVELVGAFAQSLARRGLGPATIEAHLVRLRELIEEKGGCMTKVLNRVHETSTTTGTGAYGLAGVVRADKQTFAAALGLAAGGAAQVYYCARDDQDFEIGRGTVTAAASAGVSDALSRDAIIESSNSDNAVDWTSGTRDIFSVLPSADVLQRRGVFTVIAASAVIASGAVSATVSNVLVDTEGAAASDDLDTLNVADAQTGTIVTLAMVNAARVVTVKDGTGNIVLEGGDRALSATRPLLLYRFGSNWYELLPSSKPAFLAYNSASDVNQTGGGQAPTVDFDTEVYDDGGNFSGDTFTAPIAGRYRFAVGVRLSNLSASFTSCQLILVTSNRSALLATNNIGAIRNAANDAIINGAIELDMDAGDTAQITVSVSGGSAVVTIEGTAAPQTFFSGSLI